MPTPGPLELVIILVIALLVLGPGKLPEVGASLGKSIREFRKASSDVQESVKVDADTSPLPNTPAAAGGIGVVSTLTLTASWTSDDALRNSLMLLPSDAPTSGSLPGPRMRSAITRMMTSSRGPGVGMIVVAPAVRDPI